MANRSFMVYGTRPLFLLVVLFFLQVNTRAVNNIEQYQAKLSALPPLPQNEAPVTCFKKEKAADSFAIVMLICVEMMAFLAGYVLHETHFKYFQEAACSLSIGAALGFIIRFISSVDHLKYYITFDVEFFYLFLIPPIIFESGYTMKRRKFFDHIGTILSFAFLGTTISAFVTGGILILAVQTGLVFHLTIIECLLFGALVAATDTVTVLAIFKTLKVDIDLYSNIFGESVLNDAVAIVLFQTILQFADTELNAMTILGGFGSFFLIFGGSALIGLALGLLNTLLFRYGKFYKYHILETAIVGMFGYSSYLLAEGLQLSGIVAILFISVTMAHYTIPNLSPEAKSLSILLAQLLANIADTLVFLYLGMALFAFDGDYNFGLIVAGILAIFIARISHIIPISGFFNAIRKEKKITPKFQFFIWLAGLRGGIAFTLAIELKEIEAEHNGTIGDGAGAIFTSTLIIAVFTIILMGGSITPLLKKLNVPIGVDYDNVTSSVPVDLDKKNFFIRIDKRYLKPFLIRPKQPEPETIELQLIPTSGSEPLSQTETIPPSKE